MDRKITNNNQFRGVEGTKTAKRMMVKNWCRIRERMRYNSLKEFNFYIKISTLQKIG